MITLDHSSLRPDCHNCNGTIGETLDSVGVEFSDENYAESLASFVSYRVWFSEGRTYRKSTSDRIFRATAIRNTPSITATTLSPLNLRPDAYTPTSSDLIDLFALDRFCHSVSSCQHHRSVQSPPCRSQLLSSRNH